MNRMTNSAPLRIACIGWGSLIWDSRDLNIPESKWQTDGPLVPVEFTRFSQDNRVTLIIDSLATPITVLWAELQQTNISDAKSLLAKREGCRIRMIHSVTVNEIVEDALLIDIQRWLREKSMDAAIWTGLSYSAKSNNQRPSEDEVIKWLRALEGDELRKAEQYIRQTPKQIETKYRKRIESELNLTKVNSH